MAKKSELVSAINSFANARATGDGNLVQFSAQLVGNIVDSIEFEPEDEEAEATPSDNGTEAVGTTD